MYTTILVIHTEVKCVLVQHSWLLHLHIIIKEIQRSIFINGTASVNSIVSKWFIIVTCAYIYIIIYNYIYKHTKSTRPFGPISHQINKYIN